MSVDQDFNRVGEKLQQLLKDHRRLQRENEKLHEELAAAQQIIEAGESRVQSLQQQMAVLKLAAGEMDEKEKKVFEKKLNQYIHDVEKVIAALSE